MSHPTPRPTPKSAVVEAPTAAAARAPHDSASPRTQPRVLGLPFARVYPLYLQKVLKKGRTQAELDAVIDWLTGYRGDELKRALDDLRDVETFFDRAPQLTPQRSQITGVVCGVRVEAVADPRMRAVRQLDKLVDELAKGKPLERILRRGA